jgi:hypothetical protein
MNDIISALCPQVLVSPWTSKYWDENVKLFIANDLIAELIL